jgi:hypothetical protein
LDKAGLITKFKIDDIFKIKGDAINKEYNILESIFEDEIIDK